jgi:hypothetical protein
MPKKKHAIRSESQESEFFSLISPEKLKIKSAREPSVANIKNKGTGAHDNKLAKAQGNYREPSLRRGSGMPYDTPDAFRKIATTEIADNGHDGAQSTESIAGPSSQKPQPSSSQKLNGNDPVSRKNHLVEIVIDHL